MDNKRPRPNLPTVLHPSETQAIWNKILSDFVHDTGDNIRHFLHGLDELSSIDRINTWHAIINRCEAEIAGEMTLLENTQHATICHPTASSSHDPAPNHPHPNTTTQVSPAPVDLPPSNSGPAISTSQPPNDILTWGLTGNDPELALGDLIPVIDVDTVSDSDV